GNLLQGPASDPLAIQRMRSALDAGKSFKEEVINYRKNGESYWTEIQVEPIFGADGKLRGYMGVITDLRSQFAVEQERQALLSRLQKVARHLPGFIYEYQLKADGSSAFPYASEGIINIYGVTPQQALEDANKVWQAIHPFDTE
ncbi:PAS domain-containing protein, partial [Arthrospira platensis SPKY1]|nr:PAS domain-containing protein [Arthrospira platensis SPKY1]